MSFETRIVALAQAIGADIKALNASQGSLSALNTTAKANIVSAVNELVALCATIQGSALHINDQVGTGYANVTWSADKITSAIELAKTSVKNSILDGAGTALDTLKELAQALNNDSSFATTIATELANRVRFDQAQTLTEAQKLQVRTNIGAVAAIDIGNVDRDFAVDYTASKA